MEMSGFARLEGSLPVTADIGVAWPVIASRLEDLLSLQFDFIPAPQETAEGQRMRDWIADTVLPVDRARMLRLFGKEPNDQAAIQNLDSGTTCRITSGMSSRCSGSAASSTTPTARPSSPCFRCSNRRCTWTSCNSGLLGSSFALVYGICAPFAGNIVDRIRRKTAVLGGLWTWSLICMATAVATNFRQLLFFRAAEGLGETFYFPASMSLISDYHGKRTRSRAMGTHQTSVYIGTIAGGFFGGLISQYYGWRSSFIVFGGMGVLLGFVLARLLIEPERGAADFEIPCYRTPRSTACRSAEFLR